MSTPDSWVIYKLPGELTIHGFLTKLNPSGNIADLSSHAFAWAPFGLNVSPDLLIPVSSFEGFPDLPVYIKKQPAITPTRKADYISWIESSKKEFAAGLMKKNVLSRTACKSFKQLPDIYTNFKKLCEAYPNCLVSLVSSAQHGTWLGASPEILFELKNEQLKTYSLAGTRSGHEQPWSEKERDEQEWVSIYIQNYLSNYHFTASPPTTLVMGLVEHLLTEFTLHGSQQKLYQTLTQIITGYAPTPAVCGLPSEAAWQFITEHETHTREFYSGYLGPIDPHGDTQLYVNLRCLQVQEHQLVFYAGAGITAASDAEAEWMETERKLDLLRGVLG